MTSFKKWWRTQNTPEWSMWENAIAKKIAHKAYLKGRKDQRLKALQKMTP